MEIRLEDAVPYDRSLAWRVHDAYYARQGLAAWSDGTVPSASTSSCPVARMHARLLLEQVAEREAAGVLAPGAPVSVLELGAGSGRFADRLLDALDRRMGEPGKRLLKRLRYVFSDGSTRTLEEASRLPELRRWVERGVLEFARLDLRRPDEVRTLDGRPVPDRWSAILSSYVCGATPTKVFLKTRAGFFERHSSLGVEVALAEPAETLTARLLATPSDPAWSKSVTLHHEWRETSLEATLPPPHAAAVRRAAERCSEATIPYPLVFLEALRALASRSLPGALAVVNDFGDARRSSLRGKTDASASNYGGSLAHPVQFLVVKAFCAEAGFDAVGTTGALLAVHTAAIRFEREAPPSFRASFARTRPDREAAARLADFRAAGQAAAQESRGMLAARFYERCLRFDPEDLDVLLHYGLQLLNAGREVEAIAPLQRGVKLRKVYTGHDFEFELGRACLRLGRLRPALRWFEASLAHEDHPATRTNLAKTLRRLGREAEARRALEAALRLDPAYAPARDELALLKV